MNFNNLAIIITVINFILILALIIFKCIQNNKTKSSFKNKKTLKDKFGNTSYNVDDFPFTSNYGKDVGNLSDVAFIITTTDSGSIGSMPIETLQKYLINLYNKSCDSCDFVFTTNYGAASLNEGGSAKKGDVENILITKDDGDMSSISIDQLQGYLTQLYNISCGSCKSGSENE